MCKNCESGGKPTGAIWWRVSTASQEHSPQTQIIETRALLESNGFYVPDDLIIGAEWHSLDTLECPDMQTILSLMRHGEVHAVGVLNTDRLSGEMAQKLAIMDIAKKNNVKLISVQNPIESGPDGELLETIRTYAKYLQVIRAQEGSRAGLRDRVKVDGLPATGRAPYGYAFPSIQDNKGNTVKDYTRLILDENWHVASQIWEWALQGKSLRAITFALYEKGIRTARGLDTWRTKAVAAILHNPVYAGRYMAYRENYGLAVTDKGKEGRIRYKKRAVSSKPVDEWLHLPNVRVEKPVVSWDSFLFMQDRLTNNKLMSRRNAKIPYLLSGMIRCELHRRNYRGRRHGSLLYLCQGVHHGEVTVMKCQKPSIGGVGLEQTVWDKAMKLLSDPATVIGEAENRRKAQEETEANLSMALGAVKKRKSRIDDQEMELTSKWLALGLSESVVKRQLALFKAERQWCSEEDGRLQGQIGLVRQRFATIEQVTALCDRIGDRLHNASEEDKRFILEALETRVSVFEEGDLKLSFALPVPSEDTVSHTPA